MRTIFLILFFYNSILSMDFEQLLQQHKTALTKTFNPQKKAFDAFLSFLKKSDLTKENNRQLLQAFSDELQASADWYDDQQLEADKTYNVYARMQVIIKSFLEGLST